MVIRSGNLYKSTDVEGHPHGRLGAQSKDSLSAILPRWDGGMIRGRPFVALDQPMAAERITASHPAEPIPTGVANGGYGGTRRRFRDQG